MTTKNLVILGAVAAVLGGAAKGGQRVFRDPRFAVVKSAVGKVPILYQRALFLRKASGRDQPHETGSCAQKTAQPAEQRLFSFIQNRSPRKIFRYSILIPEKAVVKRPVLP